MLNAAGLASTSAPGLAGPVSGCTILGQPIAATAVGSGAFRANMPQRRWRPLRNVDLSAPVFTRYWHSYGPGDRHVPMPVPTLAVGVSPAPIVLIITFPVPSMDLGAGAAQSYILVIS